MKGFKRQVFPPTGNSGGFVITAETKLVEVIRAHPLIPIDESAEASNCTSGELAALLLGLEFKGMVRTLPGKRYEMVG